MSFITSVIEVKISFPEKPHCMMVKSFAIKNYVDKTVRPQITFSIISTMFSNR